jgi:diacylglycerol O-acyltransferase
MVCIFERVIPFDEFVADIESKLHCLPRYEQIIVQAPYGIGYPTWEDDPHFDIRRHIFPVRLDTPGGGVELEALVGRLIGTLMDRAKPLWDIHVVTGLSSGRGALVIRLHHALADGISGIAAIMGVMLDRTPAPSRRGDRPGPHHRPRPAERSIARAIAGAAYDTVNSFISVQEGLLALAFGLREQSMQSGVKGILGLLPEIIGPVERLPFNKRCTGDRTFCWAEFDMAEVQAIRHAAGGTINDVVLSTLTGAIARYTRRPGETVDDRLIRVVCPVNLRQNESEIGNRISILPVVLPLNMNNPVNMLRAVAARMEIMKNARVASMLALAGGCFGILPPALQAALWRVVPEFTLPLPLFNIICTNIPGSRAPLYSLGRRMIAAYPQVPTGYDLGVNCAVTSYAGKLFFGMIADPQAAPDVHRLRDFLYSAFGDLRRSVRVSRTPRKGGENRAKTQTSMSLIPTKAGLA